MEPKELYKRMHANLGQIKDPNVASSLEAQIDLMYGMLNQAKEDARTDHLTQLPNYRSLIEILERETARATRHNQSLTLCFIDFDNLKHYNDTYGHVQANYAIVKLAKTILGSLRKEDVLARYGGDEFCFVLPNTDLTTSKGVVDRIKDTVNGLSIDSVVGKLPDERYKKITVSIGCTELAKGEDYMSALNRANKLMSEAKAISRETNTVKYTH